MTDREKLARLLIDAREIADMKCLDSGCTGYCVLDSSACDLCFAGLKANHLLSNGVSFAENTTIESKWISVSERLPENDTRVLVYLNIEKLDANTYTFFDTDRMLDGKWIRWNSYIAHWMPLPEPPKEGE